MAGKKRGPYAKTAQVRQRITAAALTVFAELGYRSTTMKEIAARAEISERGLVHHFPTKEALLIDVLALYERESAAVMLAADDGQPIEGMLAVIRHNREHPAILELQNLLSAEGTAAGHPAHDMFTQRYDELRWLLTHGFATRMAQSAGAESQPTVSAAELATLYVALLDGLQLQWLYNRSQIDVERSLRSFLTLVFPDGRLGVRPNPPPGAAPESAPGAAPKSAPDAAPDRSRRSEVELLVLDDPPSQAGENPEAVDADGDEAQE